MGTDLALLGLRVCLGTIFVVHGADKLGWDMGVFWREDNLMDYSFFHLQSFVGVVAGLFEFLSIEQARTLSMIAALTEFMAGWAIILGVITRVAALLLCILMTVAVYYHLPLGFYANNGGYEWAMLCLGASQVMVFMGAGRFSISGIFRAVTTAESQA